MVCQAQTIFPLTYLSFFLKIKDRMVLTVTLNPVLDRVVEIPGFKAGEVNRVSRERARIAGGKGINVSRLLKLLEVPTLAVGWLGGKVGEEIKRGLEEEEIPYDFLWIKEESRLNLTIVDPERKSETHLVEKGPRISPSEIEKLKGKLFSLAEKAKIAVFSGSVPRGVGKGIYFELVNLIKKAHPRIISVLDTWGIFLKEGLQASPYLIKPNVEELSQLRGKKLSSLEDIAREAGKIREEGTEIVVVSQGPYEVVVATPRGIFLLTPPEVNPLNTVGAGDALVGGIVAGLYRGEEIVKACSLGVAAGSASAERGREKPLGPERIATLVKRVKIKRLR